MRNFKSISRLGLIGWMCIGFISGCGADPLPEKQDWLEDYPIVSEPYCSPCVVHSDCPEDWLCRWFDYAPLYAAKYCSTVCETDQDCPEGRFECSVSGFCEAKKQNIWSGDYGDYSPERNIEVIACESRIDSLPWLREGDGLGFAQACVSDADCGCVDLGAMMDGQRCGIDSICPDNGLCDVAGAYPMKCHPDVGLCTLLESDACEASGRNYTIMGARDLCDEVGMIQ